MATSAIAHLVTMMESDTARSAYLFTAVPFRKLEPAIDPVHAAFFGGLPQAEREFSFPRIGQPAPTLKLTKNVYNLGSAFISNHCLIVSVALEEQLRQHAQYETQPVELEHPFRFRYAAGDFSFLEEDYSDGQSAENIVAHVATKFACPAPPTAFVELVPHRPTPTDESGLMVDVLEDRAEGILEDETVRVAPGWIDEWGLYWDGFFVCSETVMNLLRPHLAAPYVWIKQIGIPCR